MGDLRHEPYNLTEEQQEAIQEKLNQYYPKDAYQYVIDNDLNETSMTNRIEIKVGDSLGLTNIITILVYIAMRERIIVYRKV
jgi:hypothetical protein